MNSQQKVALITGANRGIGRMTAIRFAEVGCHLVLVGRQQRELDQLDELLRQKYGVRTLICAGNLEDATFLRAIADRSYDTFGRVDVLVNNAAWRSLETMKKISLANWNKTLRICLTAPAFLSRYVAEIMEKNGRGGAIINVSSVMSQRAGGYSPAYIACKGGLESLTYELAVLYGSRRIRVVCVNPGNVVTDMSTDYADEKGNNVSKILEEEMNDATPLMRPGTAGEIAAVICWLASPEAAFVNGTTIVADGGFTTNFNRYSLKRLQFPHTF